MPRARVRPSAWAEASVELTTRMGAQRTMRYRCDYQPFLRAFHDALFDRPEKRGVACIKPAQVAITQAMMNVLGSAVGVLDGYVMYLIESNQKVAKMVQQRWDPLVESIAALKRRFALRPEDTSSTILRRPFDGGEVHFCGAGSAGAVASFPFRVVVVDEYDLCTAEFPRQFGGIYPFALGRQTAVASGGGWTEAWFFAHPTVARAGIHGLWSYESDQGRWVFDCPHGACARPVHPTHRNIEFRQYTAFDEWGEKDPESAVLVCPHCGREISERDRCRMVWPEEQGGTGRLWTDLPPAQAKARPLVGFAINGLCNPRRSVKELARLLVSGKRGGKREMQSTLNIHFGEAFEETEAVVTADTVKRLVMPGQVGGAGGRRLVTVPGGELGVRFMTCGMDVQYAGGVVAEGAKWKPLLFYAVAVAWGANGIGYVTALNKVLGWPALYQWLRTIGAAAADGTENAGEVFWPEWAGIDSRYENQNVLEHSRDEHGQLISDHGFGGRVRILPVQYEPSMKPNRPVELMSEAKRRHPTRPELGMIDRYQLHRNTWMDRSMQRLLSRRLIVVAPEGVPADFESHCTANVQRPVKDLHGLDSDAKEWVKPDEFRDDWLQAITFAEVAAAVKMNLDSIHETPWAGGRGKVETVLPGGWSR